MLLKTSETIQGADDNRVGTNGRVNGRLTSDQAETIENCLMLITDQPLYTRS